MDDDLTITRDIELDLSEDELWELIGDGESWSQWLADESDVVVTPGGGGAVVDDGVRRHVRIDEVEPGLRVSYRWWSDDLPDAVSTVELLVVPGTHGSTLRIRETLRAAASVAAEAATRWEVRALVLWSCAFDHVLR